MPHDPEEMARMKQRKFYQEMAERFTKMADEYSPERWEKNPLPIHGYTAVITLHASSHEELARQVSGLDVNWYHAYSDYGTAERRDMTSGREHVRFEHVYPEQTEAGYALELSAWSSARREGLQ